MNYNTTFSGKRPPENAQIGDLFISTENNHVYVRAKSSGDGCWIPASPAKPAKPMDREKEDFYEYLKNTFGLTEQELIDMLKEKYPESLI